MKIGPPTPLFNFELESLEMKNMEQYDPKRYFADDDENTHFGDLVYQLKYFVAKNRINFVKRTINRLLILQVDRRTIEKSNVFEIIYRDISDFFDIQDLHFSLALKNHIKTMYIKERDESLRKPEPTNDKTKISSHEYNMRRLISQFENLKL